VFAVGENVTARFSLVLFLIIFIRVCM